MLIISRLHSTHICSNSAIMDYQYKSINRGEHSIYGQIKAANIDPAKYVFVFNLRSYDRLNKTPAMKKQEEESGVSYQEVQRANAEEVMSSGVHGVTGDSSSSEGEGDDDAEEDKRRLAERKRLFEEKRAKVGLQKNGGDEEGSNVPSVDSIAKSAMLDEKKPSEEKWADGDLESEKENFVQEELYIHGKVLIVDDKTVLCGSSNINDRVSFFFLLLTR